jgi:hypothetical protein
MFDHLGEKRLPTSVKWTSRVGAELLTQSEQDWITRDQFLIKNDGETKSKLFSLTSKSSDRVLEIDFENVLFFVSHIQKRFALPFMP